MQSYRHVKRGSIYKEIGEAEVQIASSVSIVEGTILVIYQGQDDKLWAREHSEFHDGRFELIELVTENDLKPLPCPWCAEIPDVVPQNPEKEGNGWGMVICNNKKCVANPAVSDEECVNDSLGSDAYKASAVKRWNNYLTK